MDGYQGATGNFALRLTCPNAIQATPHSYTDPIADAYCHYHADTGPFGNADRHICAAARLPAAVDPSGIARPMPGEATLIFQQDVDGYTGVADTHAGCMESSRSLSARTRELRFAYSRPPKVTTQMAPVLRFDLGMLPIEAQVIQAQLKLYLLASARNDLRGEVHLLLRDWDEQTATWQQPKDGRTLGARRVRRRPGPTLPNQAWTPS